MAEKATDRRTARTKRNLEQAMLTLLQKHDISKITVGQLAELADIGRGTFYLHYQDPYDLLDKIENQIIEKVHTLINEHYENDPNANMLTCIEKAWEYLYENKEFIKILTKNPIGYSFVEKCKVYFFGIVVENIDRENKSDLARYKAAYIISGSWGVFQQWIWSDMKKSPKEIALILREVMGNTGMW